MAVTFGFDPVVSGVVIVARGVIDVDVQVGGTDGVFCDCTSGSGDPWAAGTTVDVDAEVFVVGGLSAAVFGVVTVVLDVVAGPFVVFDDPMFV